MRVMIVSLNFPPESSTSANTAADIAHEMVRRGHEVTVIAPFPNRPAGILYPGYHRALKSVETHAGYRLIRTWSALSRRSTLVSRLSENISFGLTSMLALISEQRPDVAYFNTWPIFSEWMSTLVLFLRKVPVMCCVKDLYPETYLDGSAIWQKPVIWLAKLIDQQTYRQSRVVAPINEVMAEYIVRSRQLDHRKVRLTPDWVDQAMFSQPRSLESGFRKQHGIASDIFLAMYLGGLNRMAGLEIYIEVASRLRHRKDLCIVLVGDGSEREEITRRIEQEKLTNIRVIYPVTPEQVPAIQSAADVLMVSLAPGMALHATPSKLIYYLFSGRPILASVDPGSAAARIVSDAECGFLVRQGDSREMAAQLERMADDKSPLHRLGQNAKQYAHQQYSKDMLLPQLCDFLEQTADKPGETNDVTSSPEAP